MLHLDEQVLLSRAERFFHPPADAAPPDPLVQLRAFHDSTLPSLFDTLPRSGTSSPLVAIRTYRQPSDSSLSPFDESPPHRIPETDPAMLPAPLAVRAPFKEAFVEPNYHHRRHGGFADHLDGLETLASVAMENDRKMLPVFPVPLDWMDSLATRLPGGDP